MVQQVALVIPPEIEEGIAVGKYFLGNGAVVRDAKGRIVKHLMVVSPEKKANAARAITAKGVDLIKGNKPVAIAIGVAAAAAAASGVILAKVKKNKNRRSEFKHGTAMDQLNESLSAYVKAANEGKLALDDVDRLESALDAIEGKDRKLEIHSDQFRELVRSIRGYTERFAVANGRDRRAVVLRPIDNKTDDVSVLRECLAEQRAILEGAA